MPEKSKARREGGADRAGFALASTGDRQRPLGESTRVFLQARILIAFEYVYWQLEGQAYSLLIAWKQSTYFVFFASRTRSLARF